MDDVTCTNPDCAEVGIAKSAAGVELGPGEPILCGACGAVVYTAPGHREAPGDA